MKREKLSTNDHVEIGSELLALDRAMLALGVRVAAGCGRQSAEAKKLAKIRKEILLLRSDLENRLCRDHPAFHPATHVYFGSNEARAHFGIVAKIAPTV